MGINDCLSRFGCGLEQARKLLRFGKNFRRQIEMFARVCIGHLSLLTAMGGKSRPVVLGSSIRMRWTEIIVKKDSDEG